VAETFFGDFGEFLWSDKNPKNIKVAGMSHRYNHNFAVYSN
jgi:hypothetical protein